jgi:hypothetical protein
VPEGQLWQPQLWRKVLAELDEQERAATRPALLAGFWTRCKAVSRRSRRWRAAWWCSA